MLRILNMFFHLFGYHLVKANEPRNEMVEGIKHSILQHTDEWKFSKDYATHLPTQFSIDISGTWKEMYVPYWSKQQMQLPTDKYFKRQLWEVLQEGREIWLAKKVGGYLGHK